MNDTLSPLSDEEVRQVAALVETLENSNFDFLQLQIGDLKLTLGKGEPPAASGAAPSVAPAAAPAAPAPATPESPPPAAQATAPIEDGTVAITAPMMGRFYAQSEPGAAPFVAVGAEVT